GQDPGPKHLLGGQSRAAALPLLFRQHMPDHTHLVTLSTHPGEDLPGPDGQRLGTRPGDRAGQSTGDQFRPGVQPATASGISRTTSRRSSTDRSVSHSSPAETALSASALLRVSISSTRSSTVPTQSSVRTCTLRLWPIRKARSVAWCSTAGFHHRSTCTTWLAAVRFRPVPAALRDRRKIAGPFAVWKRRVISSLSAREVPPCSQIGRASWRESEESAVVGAPRERT